MNKWPTFRKAIPVALLIVIVGWSAWKLPIVRQAFIRVFLAPQTISVPVLSAANAILPGNVNNIQAREHWGNGEFISMAWSEDETYFGIGTTLGVNLYDGASLRLLRYIELSMGEINVLAFSPDNSLLAVASDGRAIAVYDLNESQIVNEFAVDGWVSALSFLQDGTPVAVVFPYGSAFQSAVMKLTDGKWEVVALRGDSMNQLYAATFDQDSQTFILELGKSMELVDPDTGIAQIVPGGELTGDAYLPSNGLWLETKEDGRGVAVHSVGRVQKVILFDDYFDRVLLSPDGRSFAILDRFNPNMAGWSLEFWQVVEPRQFRKITITDADTNPDVQDSSPDGKTYMVFSPTGEQLALWTSPSTVDVYSVAENGPADRVITDPYAGIADIGITLSGQIRGIRCAGAAVNVVDLPVGTLIDQWKFEQPTCGQISSSGARVMIRESESHQILYEVDANNLPVDTTNSLCCNVFSFDGDVGASSQGAYSGEPKPVFIWEEGSGVHRWMFSDSGVGPFAVAVAPSGQYVSALSSERTRLWVHGIETGRDLPAFSTWPKVAFSPDEKYLATADAILNLETRNWIDLESTEDIFAHMNDDVLCRSKTFVAPAFSPDGQLVVARVCGVLKFWSPRTGELLAELPDPYFSTKLMFSPDGVSLVGFAPGSIAVWRLPK